MIDVVLTDALGSRRHHSPGNRIMLGARIPIASHFKRQEPALPRIRRRGDQVRTRSWLGGKGRPDILSTAGRGGACGGQGRDEQQRRRH